MTQAVRLRPRMVEKIWGSSSLPPPFSNKGDQRIGEVWFDVPPEMNNVLVKYLFTSEKLSVQVHPSDLDMPAGQCGKDECWLVLDAVPNARLALGFKQDISAQAMRAAALDGSIEDLLEWHDARPGDFFYLPSGTVHAIGPGISLVEVQQNCDITYRLFDYGRLDHGRPRALHLDQAVAVAIGAPHPAALRKSCGMAGNTPLLEGPFFRIDRLAGAPTDSVLARYAGAVLAVPLAGTIKVDTLTVRAGECCLLPDLARADFSQSLSALITQPVRQCLAEDYATVNFASN